MASGGVARASSREGRKRTREDELGGRVGTKRGTGGRFGGGEGEGEGGGGNWVPNPRYRFPQIPDQILDSRFQNKNPLLSSPQAHAMFYQTENKSPTTKYFFWVPIRYCNIYKNGRLTLTVQYSQQYNTTPHRSTTTTNIFLFFSHTHTHTHTHACMHMAQTACPSHSIM
jgi:hypothetical protein